MIHFSISDDNSPSKGYSLQDDYLYNHNSPSKPHSQQDDYDSLYDDNSPSRSYSRQDDSPYEKHAEQSCYQRMHVRSGQIINDDRFQNMMIFLIIINAITIGIATFTFENKNINNIFNRIDFLFLLFFTIEIALHCFYHGVSLFYDAWLVFDFIIITISWLGLGIALSSFKRIRAFRVVRVIRLISRVKTMKDLVSALMKSTSRIFTVEILLVLFFYVFGVIFTQLFKNLYEEGYTTEDYFSRLDKTFFTLFQLMTLDSWSDITKQVMQVFPFAWAPIIIFIVISSFVVINLVIAVICDSVSEVQKIEFESHIERINSIASERSQIGLRELELKLDKVTALVKKVVEKKQSEDEKKILVTETKIKKTA